MRDEEDRVSLRIQIGDREYPLRVSLQEKEKVLLAAKNINDKVSQYQSRYAEKDMQDFIAMTALQMATKLLEGDSAGLSESQKESLDALNRELGDYINSVQRS